jgi:hypothetical protein
LLPGISLTRIKMTVTAQSASEIMKKGMPLQATEGPGQWPRAPVAETIVNP